MPLEPELGAEAGFERTAQVASSTCRSTIRGLCVRNSTTQRRWPRSSRGDVASIGGGDVSQQRVCHARRRAVAMTSERHQGVWVQTGGYDTHARRAQRRRVREL